MLAADEGEGILDHSMAGESTTVADNDAFPREVGPYVVTEMIGRGGMAVVFRAHAVRLQRDVALKFLRAVAHPDREAQARLINEAGRVRRRTGYIAVAAMAVLTIAVVAYRQLAPEAASLDPSAVAFALAGLLRSPTDG